VSDDPQRRRDIGEIIRDLRRASRLSVRRLSELAGISNPYLSQVERGLRRPSAQTLQRIAKGLAISAETLYLQVGILEEFTPEEAATEFESRLRRDPLLDEEGRAALVEHYRSLVSARHRSEEGGAGGQ